MSKFPLRDTKWTSSLRRSLSLDLRLDSERKVLKNFGTKLRMECTRCSYIHKIVEFCNRGLCTNTFHIQMNRSLREAVIEK